MAPLPLILLLQLATPAQAVAAPAPVTAPAQPVTPPTPRDATAAPTPAPTEDCHCGVPRSPRGPR